ncbi:MAG TPA: cell division protein ZipA [Xanthomonadales bacterium]|nr:cell division protein ZipA [Xanthomonadales bacterium]
MEASTLRWVLIVVGLIILALIVMFGNPGKNKKPRASRRDKTRDAAKKKGDSRQKIRKEPTLGPAPDSNESDPDSESNSGDQGELAIGDEAPKSEPKKPKKPAGPAPDRIVTLYLIARDNHVITGAQLLEAAVKTGMDFGEMDIFHRIGDREDQSVFSLANASKPGHFDRSAWPEFETRALVLFMTLPNPRPALDAWDAMLATARRMAGILNAEVHDEERHPFSRQREAQLREEMRDYERQRVSRRD